MKSDSRNGVQPRPSRPIVCMTIPSMKSTTASTRLRTPLGALSGSRRDATNSSTTVINAASTAMSAILLKVGKRSRQRMTSLIGGNSRASIDLLSAWARRARA